VCSAKKREIKKDDLALCAWVKSCILTFRKRDWVYSHGLAIYIDIHSRWCLRSNEGSNREHYQLTVRLIIIPEGQLNERRKRRNLMSGQTNLSTKTRGGSKTKRIIRRQFFLHLVCSSSCLRAIISPIVYWSCQTKKRCSHRTNREILSTRTYTHPCKIIPETVSIGIQRPIFFFDRPSLNFPIRTLDEHLEIRATLLL
jgi:hypothetical protein